MFKKFCVVVIACLLLYDIVEGKKTKKSKRPKPDEKDHVPQPDVVSYSTFGFNDVGTYEGFVPSSPDYTRFLTGGADEESSTKQLPSSYPSSIESTGYGNNFGPQSFDGQSISVSNDDSSQPGFVQYPQSLNGFLNNPGFDTDIAQFKNAPTDEIYGSNTQEFKAPVYGTKISSKNKFKFDNQFNHTDFQLHSDNNEDKYNFNFNDVKQPTFDNKPPHSEFSNSFQNIPTFPLTSAADFSKTDSGDTQNPLKFPRVVDFTKMKQFYPTELDTSQFSSASSRPESYDTSASALGNNMFANTYSDNINNNKPANPTSTFKEIYEHKTNDEDADKSSVKSYTYSTKNNIYNYSSNTDDKPNLHETKPSSESKKKLKNKPWAAGSYSFKKWKDPSPVKGYEYSTNFSNMSFKYGDDEPKQSFSSSNSIDEVVPASSNIDFTKYHSPEMDYSKFKKIPSYKVHEDNEFDAFPSYKETSPFKEKPSKPDFNPHKHLFSPESSSSYWGNSFKSTDFSSFKSHANKHQFNDVTNNEVVNIQPRRPNKFSYGKPYENKPSDWPQFSRQPSKNRPWTDWTKEVSNKFKSEEDLLGLRNHDTSLPSYLPTQSSNNYFSDEQDYKKLVDKWRQSYLKSKYKDSLRDYESYASEAKPMHVPVPKPYPELEHAADSINLQIEVPHPIIVPVPQPYPVRVPVAKPVAVPVFREITVPIEKLVPYPIYKKVPYPIEKLVPVPVEKEVAVPVVKPYPVHVPYVRPVFHHTKSRDEYDSYDDDYFPRQESSKKQVQYRKKKPNYSSIRERPLDRPRRPSRTIYQDRNRRRWPDRRRPSGFNEQHPRRPTQQSLPYRHRDLDEGYEEERSEYILYCKRTGNC